MFLYCVFLRLSDIKTIKLNNSAEEKVPDITAPFYKLHQRKTKLHIDKCNGFFFIDETQEILLNFELPWQSPSNFKSVRLFKVQDCMSKAK